MTHKISLFLEFSKIAEGFISYIEQRGKYYNILSREKIKLNIKGYVKIQKKVLNPLSS